MSESRPTAPEPNWERLQRAAKVYGAAMHKAGQEEVRHSEYRERAQELMLAARDELDAAFREALAGPPPAEDPDWQDMNRIYTTEERALDQRLDRKPAPEPSEEWRARLQEIRERIQRAVECEDVASASAYMPDIAWLGNQLEECWRSQMPGPEAVTKEELRRLLTMCLEGREADASLREISDRYALGGSPQPPAGDLPEAVIDAAWEAFQRPQGTVGQFGAKVRLRYALRAALRGGSHQPDYEGALRNVLLYVRRGHRRGDFKNDDADNLIRFCAEVGVVPNILRGASPQEPGKPQ